MKSWFCIIMAAFLVESSRADPGVLPKKEVEASWFDASIGVVFLSNLVFRGATTFDYPVLFPSVNLQFADKRISLNGKEGLSGKMLRGELYQLSIGLRPQYDEKPPFALFGEQKPFQNDRSFSLESSISFIARPLRYVECRVLFAQELIEHYGQYGEGGMFFDVGYISSKQGAPYLTAQVGGSIGIGSRNHNVYAYGPQGEAGFNNYGLHVNLVSPGLVDRVVFVAGFSYFEILGFANRNADLVVTNPSGFLGSLVMTYQLPI